MKSFKFFKGYNQDIMDDNIPFLCEEDEAV